MEGGLYSIARWFSASCHLVSSPDHTFVSYKRGSGSNQAVSWVNDIALPESGNDRSDCSTLEFHMSNAPFITWLLDCHGIQQGKVMAKVVVPGKAARLQLSLTAEQHQLSLLLGRILSYLCQQELETVALVSLAVLPGLDVCLNMFCNSLDLFQSVCWPR